VGLLSSKTYRRIVYSCGWPVGHWIAPMCGGRGRLSVGSGAGVASPWWGWLLILRTWCVLRWSGL